jgi:hypothetical protein
VIQINGLRCQHELTIYCFSESCLTNLNELRMNDDVMLTRLEVIHASTHYNKVVQTFVNDNVLHLVKGD